MTDLEERRATARMVLTYGIVGALLFVSVVLILYHSIIEYDPVMIDKVVGILETFALVVIGFWFGEKGSRNEIVPPPAAPVAPGGDATGDGVRDERQ